MRVFRWMLRSLLYSYFLLLLLFHLLLLLILPLRAPSDRTEPSRTE